MRELRVNLCFNLSVKSLRELRTYVWCEFKHELICKLKCALMRKFMRKLLRKFKSWRTTRHV